MLKASAFPEVWPAGPATRPCYGAYFQHPATERQPAAIYDNYGQCIIPGMVATMAPVQESGNSIWTWIILAGVAYGAWRFRKVLF